MKNASITYSIFVHILKSLVISWNAILYILYLRSPSTCLLVLVWVEEREKLIKIIFLIIIVLNTLNFSILSLGIVS